MSAEMAGDLGASALSFIAADPVLFDRFLGVTGLNVASMRQAAATSGFLPGVLDFVLAHEPTLLAFADNVGIDPRRVAFARSALRNGDQDGSVSAEDDG